MKYFLLNCVASDFENETFANFNECLQDETFKKMVKELGKNITQSNFNQMTKKLIDYANENLI
jgi:hypothetical protein